MRKGRRKWTEGMIIEAERVFSNGHMKTKYEISNDRKRSSVCSPEKRKKRWIKNFLEIYNRPQQDDSLEAKSEIPVVDEIDTSLI